MSFWNVEVLGDITAGKAQLGISAYSMNVDRAKSFDIVPSPFSRYYEVVIHESNTYTDSSTPLVVSLMKLFAPSVWIIFVLIFLITAVLLSLADMAQAQINGSSVTPTFRCGLKKWTLDLLGSAIATCKYFWLRSTNVWRDRHSNVWSVCWLIGCLIHSFVLIRLIDYFIDWLLVFWLIDWLIDWLIIFSNQGLIHWLMDWGIDCLLIDWLSEWIVFPKTDLEIRMYHFDFIPADIEVNLRPTIRSKLFLITIWLSWTIVIYSLFGSQLPSILTTGRQKQVPFKTMEELAASDYTVYGTPFIKSLLQVSTRWNWPLIIDRWI